MSFPSDFLWGSATASYQVEGRDPNDGRGECIWDRFSHTPGKVFNGDTGDVACDHYHRYPQDITLMRDLGFQAYRFSISWPRILPLGTGSTNSVGLDFYDRLVDEILKNGLLPFVTLYHWDLPQALQDRGGWTNSDIVKWYSDYAHLITQHLGDRVKHWTTHNEPAVVAYAGNLFGIHAPGNKDMATALQVAHHLHLAHGAAIQVIRRNVKDSVAGIVLNCSPGYAANPDDPRDVEAVQRFDGFQHRWFLDPVFKGEYPADIVELLTEYLNGIDVTEVRHAAQPIDWLGINYYSRNVIRAADQGPLYYAHTKPEGAEYTEMKWEVYPPGLSRILERVHEDYHPKALYVTENGAAFADEVVDGQVHDDRRVAYFEEHFKSVQEAIAKGVPVKGYFVWSFMDNFEWAEGYSKRFGIVYVDYKTQTRIPKDSAFYVRNYIRQLTPSR